MSETAAPRPDDDEALLAELFDTLLQSVLDGETPDVRTLLPDRPDLRERVQQTFDLACSVAGRREPGRPVLGGYEILRELGRGGMGTVYLARHEELLREVAIKVLPQSLALSARSKRRFLDEARTLARLRHPNIVHIHRIVDHSEMLAFEMEFVEGPSLQGLLNSLRAAGPRPSPQDLQAALPAFQPALVRSTVEFFVKVGLAVARALAEVHRQGLVHRDVKPSNILLRPDGTPVLADFGLAREGDLAITQTGAFAGTPTYAAPERLRDGDLGLDGRADVYSLGATLYEAISLTPPYQGRSTQEVLRKIENGVVVPLRKRAPHASKDLQTVLGKAMETDPRRRYATAAEFADDLERLLALQPVRARPRGLARRVESFVRRHRTAMLGAAAGAVLVAGVVWPFVGAMQAEAKARAEAASVLRSARDLLLDPACLDFRAADSGSATTSPDLAAQVQALRRVEKELATAVRLDPRDENAALEHDVVRMALWLRTEAPSHVPSETELLREPTFVERTNRLPSLARSLAGRIAVGRASATEVRTELADKTPRDRFATGLLAALLAEPAICEATWADLDALGFEHPLLDAGLGMLAAADGAFERAYPRLFHATRTFPNSRALQFELADAALAQGDPSLAQAWLDTADDPPAVQDSARRERMRADVLAATGHRDEAEAIYREMLRRWPADGTSRLRLARLAIERGELRRAQEHLGLLLARAPDRVDARLDLARIALHGGNRADYLRQAAYAFTRARIGNDSRGAVRDLVEILRLGGLGGLIADLGSQASTYVDWRHVQPPTDLWRSGEDAHRVEAWLRAIETYERHAREIDPFVGVPMTKVVRCLREVAREHQGLAASIPFVPRLVFETAPVLASVPWVQNRTTRMLLPFQNSLGARLHSVGTIVVVPEVRYDRRVEHLAAITTLGPLDGSEEVLLAISPVGAVAGRGRVQVRSAGDGTCVAELEQQSEEQIFGYALCDLGDVDGDAYHDFAVGAPLRRRATTSSGSVLVYSGRERRLLRQIHGEGVGFGVALANLGDVDGDGVPDLAVGTSPELRNAMAQGEVQAFSGATGSELWQAKSDRAGVWYGAAIATVGDVDGDGCRDLLVGGNHGGAKGLVRVLSSRTGEVRFSLEDDGESGDFGRTVFEFGDVDRDGIPEYGVGAPEIGSDPPKRGRVLVFAGRTGQRLTSILGDHAGDFFGLVATPLPEWRGDGRPAVAISAVRMGVTGSGYVRVFDVPSLQPLQTFYMPTGNGMLGMRTCARADRANLGRFVLASSVASDTSFAMMGFRYTPEVFR